MSTDVPIRILVVDDHPVVRQGIAVLVHPKLQFLISPGWFGVKATL
jgi:hypothetical protein